MIQPSALRNFEKILTPVGGGYRMKERMYPWSITPNEGRFLYECARLCAPPQMRPIAFEIATAFGYSGAWISAGLSWRRGRLVTMDSYIEETTTDTDPAAKTVTPQRDSTPLGLDYARRGAEAVGTVGIMHPRIAKSPEDVVSAFLFGTDDLTDCAGRRTDLFFLDGHHLNGQPVVDWMAVKPMLDPQSVTIFHDSHLGDVKDAMSAAEEFYGARHFNPDLPGYSMVAVTRNPRIHAALATAAAAAKSPYDRTA